MSGQLLDFGAEDDRNKAYLLSKGWKYYKYYGSTGWEYTDVNGCKYYRNSVMDARTLQDEWDEDASIPTDEQYRLMKEYNHENDAVNHPAHYNQAGIEVIDVIEAYAPTNYHLGNVIKYVCRSGHKGSELEDWRKARWYLDRLITMKESGDHAVPDISSEQGDPT